MMTTNEMITYDRIVELGIATVDEINLAFRTELYMQELDIGQLKIT